MIFIDHLTKQFGDLLAVDDLSLKVHEGEILGFLGPNGAGKTTTIRMLCGLLQADSGEIHWDKHPQNLIEAIGYCPQENIYWPRLTCLEQLIYVGQMYSLPRSMSEKSALKLLSQMGLDEKKGILAEKLSGGMQRRLNIALALIHDPPILVLDEPESGLDPQSRVLVRDMIKELAKRKTIILTTHNMDEAEKLADRVAIIDHGKLLKLDTLEQLKNSVGEGDLLEISIDINAKEERLKNLEVAMAPLSQSVTLFENTLRIRNKDLLGKISAITTVLKEQQIEYSGMQLRKNSLEDVFIHLTGRALRE